MDSDSIVGIVGLIGIGVILFIGIGIFLSITRSGMSETGKSICYILTVISIIAAIIIWGQIVEFLVTLFAFAIIGAVFFIGSLFDLFDDN